MHRRTFVTALSASALLGALGCRDTPAPAPDPAAVFDPAALQAVFDGLIADQAWLGELQDTPQALLDLQRALQERDMPASARLVGAVGATLIPALGGALLAVNPDDPAASQDAMRSAWTSTEAALRSVSEDMPSIQAEMEAAGFTGDSPVATEQLRLFNALEVGGRKEALARGQEDEMLVNLALLNLQSQKTWLRSGGSAAGPLAQAESDLGTLASLLESARPQAGTNGPPPPPGLREDWCDFAGGVPSWIPYALSFAGYSSDPCDEERLSAEILLVVLNIVSSLSSIIMALFTNVISGLALAGPFAIFIILAFALYTLTIVACKTEGLFETIDYCTY